MGRFPNCEDPGNGGYEWFNFDVAFSCMDTSEIQTNPNLLGCDAACHPCRQDSEDQFWAGIGIRANAERFLRASPNAESRSASGRYDFPLSTGKPIFIPWQGGWYQVAMCWQIFSPGEGGAAREFWSRSICNCIDAGSSPQAPGSCTTPPDPCHEAGGSNFVTCFIHTSRDWPPFGALGEITCTGKHFGSGPAAVRMIQGRMGLPGMIRHGHNGGGAGEGTSLFHQPSRGCNPWLNAGCIGRQINREPCPIGGAPDPPLDWFARPGDGGQAHHQFWNFLLIDKYEAEFREVAGMTGEARSIIAHKNRVVTWVDDNKTAMPIPPTGLANLDRVDIFSPATNDNQSYWARFWNFHTGGTEHLSGTELAAIFGADPAFVWGNCFTRRTGFAVTGYWIPWDISVEVGLHFLNDQDFPDPCSQSDRVRRVNRTFPTCRVKLRVRMMLHAEFTEPGPHELTNTATFPTPLGDTTQLEIFNDDTLTRRWPRVLVAGDPEAAFGIMDQIVWVDNDGLEYSRRPPLDWEWIGEMSPLRDPGREFFTDEWFNDIGGREGCCGLAVQMARPGTLANFETGLKVRAAYDDPIWPAVFLDGPERSVVALGGAAGLAATIEARRTKLHGGSITVASAFGEAADGC